jgi:hypothetical protein
MSCLFIRGGLPLCLLIRLCSSESGRLNRACRIQPGGTLFINRAGRQAAEMNKTGTWVMGFIGGGCYTTNNGQ